MTDLYYIQSQYSPCGNCVSWWAKDANGYTSDLSKAWKVPLSQAQSICDDKSRRDKFWKAEDIDAYAVRHFDFQNFRSIQERSK